MTKNAQWRQAILDEASIALVHGVATSLPGARSRPAMPGAECNSPASDQLLTI